MAEPDYLTMSRAWADRNGHPDKLTADEIKACVAILRPSLLAMAADRRAVQLKPGTAA